MALREERVLSTVELSPANSTIFVNWVDRIYRDDQVIASSFHRTTYEVGQKDQFLAEVPNAEAYVTAMGW